MPAEDVDFECESAVLRPVLAQSDADLSPTAWVNCPVWVNRTNAFYKSPEFLTVEAENREFLDSLRPLVGNRSLALSAMYNTFDLLNVQATHNATFLAQLNAIGSDTLARARDLAKYVVSVPTDRSLLIILTHSYHEYGAFTDPSLGGIGNIAGRTILPRVISSLQDFAAGSDVKLAHMHVSYK